MDDLTTLIKNILEAELKQLKKYGVDHLGYRYFLPDGRSFGCPTVEPWYKINRTEEFYNAMKEYLSAELSRLYDNGFSYVARSKDHKNNIYLDWLVKLKLDNSIGLYKFNPKRIDSFFFILESGNGEQRDLLINNRKWLEYHVNGLSKKMDNLQLQMLKLNKNEIILDKEICLRIFKARNNQHIHKTIMLDGRSIDLTSREIEVLLSLAEVGSTKFVALNLDISIKAVEKHIHKLKEKFCINSKSELINIANKPQIQILMKHIYDK